MNAQAPGFDIAALDVSERSEDGFDVPIINIKTGALTGLFIRVQGAFSERFQDLLARNKQKKELRQRSVVARAVAPDEDDETARVMADVTLGWYTEVEEEDATGQRVVKRHDHMVEGGKQLTFSHKEALRIYTAYPLIRSQVLAAAMDATNFMKG